MKQSIKVIDDTVRSYNILLVSEREERNNGEEEILEEIMVETITKLMTDTTPQIQVTQQISIGMKRKIKNHLMKVR